jgi:hypothetical protein
MATTVPNPFDTQQPSAQNTPPTGGTQPMNTGSAANTGYQQSNPVPNLQPQTYTAQTAQVNAPTETVQGQVNSILAQDGPLMQRARTLAAQQMSQRGLVNSSMAVGAAQAAMMDRATPIAAQDAQTYGQRSMFNTDATNQANQFNTQQTNQMFQFGQDVASRFGLASMEQSGLDFRQAREIASREMLTRLEQAGITNRFDQELALRSSQFNAEQINLERRQIIDNQAQLERLNLSINAQNQNIPTSFAASISNTTMAGVNAVMSDPQMSADAKRAAITNLVNYANAQIAWAEKFYNTAIPRLPEQPA